MQGRKIRSDTDRLTCFYMKKVETPQPETTAIEQTPVSETNEKAEDDEKKEEKAEENKDDKPAEVKKEKKRFQFGKLFNFKVLKSKKEKKPKADDPPKVDEENKENKEEEPLTNGVTNGEVVKEKEVSEPEQELKKSSAEESPTAAAPLEASA